MFARLRCGGNLPQCLAFGTGEGLLWYGICVPYSKRPPGVRDAFSEAFGVKNRRFRDRRDIRCQKQPSLVRDASSKARRTADSTDCGQPPAAPDVSSVRETAPALFVRSGPFHHFLRPANAELVSSGPFPCSFDGTRYQKRPPLGGEQT